MIFSKSTKTAIFLIPLILISLFSQNKNITQEIINQKAPAEFKARFETTAGNFEVTAERKYSPQAVDRFYQLITNKYFTDIPIYRVINNFVAQFGTVDGELDSAWSKYIIYDEPVIKSNEVGTIAFARAGKNTRGTQLYINLKNNFKLDTVSYGETLGFPAFAYVSKGMDVVNKFYKEYGDEPRLKLDSIASNAVEFFKSKYPKLDYIKKAYVIE
jgi:peptidyl-prolyl cis-trans isomerase A (cyclophilin A)